ncbi:MAG: NADH:flavin oxidoreductase/NADH oxidase [Promicromonosporaceae bacterium]|nr:NADH:flavin oxidoreductase/NADH oxidase [Promicromonosporaceae bacterium]
MSLLFEPLQLRELRIPNRLWLAPMCQYSAASDGLPGDWHLAHYGARATGGFGLLIAEATAITPIGRISRHDVGLWDDGHIDAWRRVTDFCGQQGARMGVQLAHAGRKAGIHRGWSGKEGTLSKRDGGWETVGPSDAPFPGYAAPRGLTTAEVADIPRQFAEAARRADAAGFDVVEIHAAHGYLLHQFLSPLSNNRSDEYGGSPRNRARLLLEVAEAVRGCWPEHKPLFVRISATDWLEGGLNPDDLAPVMAQLGSRGVDLVNVSTGGLLPAPIEVGPGYQVPHSERIRRKSGLPTAAAGLITSPQQAEQILVDRAADAIALGRPALRDPHWPLHAAAKLRADIHWAPQYLRGR